MPAIKIRSSWDCLIIIIENHTGKKVYLYRDAVRCPVQMMLDDYIWIWTSEVNHHQSGNCRICKISSTLLLFYPILMKFEGILQKGPYPPCLRMADKALLAGYPRNDAVFQHLLFQGRTAPKEVKYWTLVKCATVSAITMQGNERMPPLIDWNHT